jgi:hypothetical protein
MVNVKAIVGEYLIANKFDGLWSCDNECACDLNDLMPCDDLDIESCEPGYKKPCDGQSYGCPCDFHIGPKKENHGEKE